jgi:CxxC motif-containing protein (DUF1111 family)
MNVRLTRRSLVPLACVALFAACDEKGPTAPDGPDDDVALSGGATTIFDATSMAFTFPAPNLGDLARHLEGDAAFDAAFVAAPAVVHAGLGPVFNHNACVACHVNNGRGRPPEPGRDPQSLLLRISVPGTDSDGSGGPNPVPGFGAQLNDKAIFDVQPEASVRVSYSEATYAFDDGTPYHLRTPTFTISNAYIPWPSDAMVSPRVALPIFGRGLLEAIPEEVILALADESDADGDGISGRPNWVYDYEAGRDALGRFGWKANQPNLDQQTAAAYRNDMGVTNPVFTTDSAAGQPQSDGQDDDPELSEQVMRDAAFYTRTLAVPARRNVSDPTVQRGERLFEEARCAVCHVPSMSTGPALEPSLANQRIRPYTDLLLHDMGAELADDRPDFLADGREWRTPPLWGLGLTRVVQGETFLLHDGRARNILEAVMWHGGEGEFSREFVRGLSEDERGALITFLESL